MKIKPVLFFVLSLLPVIIFGGYNQYLSVNYSAWQFISWKIADQLIPLLIAAIVADLLCRYLFKKQITLSIIYSFFTFLCIFPISTSGTEIFVTFLLGCIISLAKLTLKKHLFYLNPAVAARLLIFLLHLPVVNTKIVNTTMVNTEIVNTGIAHSGIAPVDAITSATPLAYCHIMLANNQPCHNASLSILSLFLGHWQGSLGETSKLGIILGALLLIAFRLIQPAVIIYGLIGAAVAWLSLVYLAGFHQLPALLPYLLMGSFLFGLIFMTTDMFTRCLSKNEYAIYGLLTGLLCILLRVIAPFPEATLLSLIISQLLFLLYTALRKSVPADKQERQGKP